MIMSGYNHFYHIALQRVIAKLTVSLLILQSILLYYYLFILQVLELCQTIFQVGCKNIVFSYQLLLNPRDN